jgi:Zn-dependent M28 family amino/carboxypeptidase
VNLRAAAIAACGMPLLGCTSIPTDCLPEDPPAFEIALVKPGDVERNLERVARSNVRRRKLLVELFQAAGCTGDALVDKPSGAGLPNLSCTLPGADDARILVGAHFDKTSAGWGAADNWSGASLLPSLFASLAARPRRHTFEFVGFAAEERGLLGSKAFVHQLDAAARSRIRAMVNIDTLGLGPMRLDVPQSDAQLACYFAASAKLVGAPLTTGGIPPGYSSDFDSFRDAGIPVIDFSSITLRSRDILHTRDDRLGVIDRPSHYAAYALIAAYLALLDDALPAPDAPEARAPR